RVVSDCVEDRKAPPALAVGEAELAVEQNRRVGDVRGSAGIVAAARGGGGDDVQAGPRCVQDIPAAGEPRLVSGRRDAPPCRGELRAPEPARVRLVPDHDVVDSRITMEEARNELAVSLALWVGLRGGVGRPVDGEDDPQAATPGREDHAIDGAAVEDTEAGPARGARRPGPPR